MSSSNFLQLPSIQGKAGICWGTSIKPVESLLFISISFINLFFHSCLIQSWQALSWIHEFGRKWTKGTEKANSELNYCLTPTCINNFRRRITERKGPAYCWTGTSALGINCFQSPEKQANIQLETDIYVCMSIYSQSKLTNFIHPFSRYLWWSVIY